MADTNPPLVAPTAEATLSILIRDYPVGKEDRYSDLFDYLKLPARNGAKSVLANWSTIHEVETEAAEIAVLALQPGSLLWARIVKLPDGARWPPVASWTYVTGRLRALERVRSEARAPSSDADPETLTAVAANSNGFVLSVMRELLEKHVGEVARRATRPAAKRERNALLLKRLVLDGVGSEEAALEAGMKGDACRQFKKRFLETWIGEVYRGVARDLRVVAQSTSLENGEALTTVADRLERLIEMAATESLLR